MLRAESEVGPVWLCVEPTNDSVLPAPNVSDPTEPKLPERSALPDASSDRTSPLNNVAAAVDATSAPVIASTLFAAIRPPKVSPVAATVRFAALSILPESDDTSPLRLTEPIAAMLPLFDSVPPEMMLIKPSD